jgi:hypothetical protein
MKTFKVAIALCAATTMATSPTMAQTKTPVVPPDVSAADQYTESFPGPGGNQPTQPGASDPSVDVIAMKYARRLQRLGQDGRAAGGVLAETAPPLDHREIGGTSGQVGNADGSSTVNEIVGLATGTSHSTGSGLLLPLAIGATVLGAAGYLWQRTRRAV